MDAATRRPTAPQRIRGRLIRSFSIAILLPSLTTALVAVGLLYSRVMGQAEARVASDLEAAREILQNEQDRAAAAVRIHASRGVIGGALGGGDRDALGVELGRALREEGLDVLTLLDAKGRVVRRARNPGLAGDEMTWDPLVVSVISKRTTVGGLQVVPREHVEKEAPELAELALMEITPTLKAQPTSRTRETPGMFLRAAAPVFDASGRFLGVLVGGVLLNRNDRIVDKVRTAVFRDEVYRGREVGTATIFQNDVRIATNVKNADGSRAVTTRVSAEVAAAVLGRGETWRGRAFVVNDWYIAAYVPLPDVGGRTAGMLYVGTLEQPYLDMLRESLLLLLGLTLLGVVVVGVVAIVMAERLSRPLRAIAEAAAAVAEGDFAQRVDITSNDEIGDLGRRFNRMTEKLARAHVELQAWGDSLEQKVQARTADLAAMQEQMLQRDKLASLGELVAGIAHEINNPNTFIRGNIAIVSESLETILPLLDEIAAKRPELRVARLPYAQFREHIAVLVNDIGKGAEKIQNIVSDLKKFARHDDGLLSEDVSIDQVVESCLRLVHNQLKHTAKVETALAKALPAVRGNVQRLEQVLVNILINAAHAVEERPQAGHIWIRTRAQEVRAIARQAGPGAERRRDGAARPIPLPRQRARAREHHQRRGAHRAGARADARVAATLRAGGRRRSTRSRAHERQTGRGPRRAPDGGGRARAHRARAAARSGQPVGGLAHPGDVAGDAHREDQALRPRALTWARAAIRPAGAERGGAARRRNAIRAR